MIKNAGINILLLLFSSPPPPAVAWLAVSVAGRPNEMAICCAPWPPPKQISSHTPSHPLAVRPSFDAPSGCTKKGKNGNRGAKDDDAADWAQKTRDTSLISKWRLLLGYCHPPTKSSKRGGSAIASGLILIISGIIIIIIVVIRMEDFVFLAFDL